MTSAATIQWNEEIVRRGGASLRRIVPAVLLLSLACTPVIRADRAQVDTDIVSSLRASGEAHVVIALVQPAGYADPRVDASRIRAEIARMQAEVLEALDPADYRERHRYASVPAMAGTLLSERGLEILLRHPRVRRVDLDPAGTGTGVP